MQPNKLYYVLSATLPAVTGKPRLRAVDVLPVELETGPGVALRDPEGLSSRVLFVPRPLRAVLELFDGAHDADAMLAALGRPGDDALRGKIEEIAATLEEALLLEGPAVQKARAALLLEYERAPARPAAHAGGAYPAAPEELRRELDSHMKAGARSAAARAPLKALVAPHIDYRRGGASYGAAYGELQAQEGADLYFILGTCHAGLERPFAATLKSYETPLGPAETDAALVRRLAAAAELDLLAEEPAHRRRSRPKFRTRPGRTRLTQRGHVACSLPTARRHPPRTP